jgi:hypothetical protein
MWFSNADTKRATELSALIGSLLGGQPVDLGAITVLSAAIASGIRTTEAVFNAMQVNAGRPN